MKEKILSTFKKPCSMAFFLVIGILLDAHAQHQASLTTKNQNFGKNEIGGGIGLVNYMGDLAPVIHPANFNLGGLLFYKRNYSYATSQRFSFMYGQISGTDAFFGGRPFNNFRREDFEGGIMELSSTIEYNFL